MFALITKKTGVATLVSVKADFRTSKVVGAKKEYCIAINRSILQEDIAIINVFVSNKSAKIFKAKIDKSWGELDLSTTVVRDFHIPLSEMDGGAGRKSVKTKMNSTAPPNN